VFKRTVESLREVIRRRELIRFLVTSNLKSSQKTSVLGYLWWLLDPLMLMVVYTLMMKILARTGKLPGFPMFLFCGLLPFKSFAGSLMGSVGTIVSNQQLIKQVPFPRAVIPISLVLTNFFHCVIGIVPLVLIGLVYGIRPTWRYALLPIPLLILLIFTLGLSLLVSFFGVWFRDLQNILQFVTRLWWYMSPGLYGLYWVDQRLGHARSLVFRLNPLSHIFPAIRQAVYYPGARLMWDAPPKGLTEAHMAFNWAGLSWVALASVLLLVIGFVVFVNNEHKFGKVL